jgi:alpha/beta superfamily hydrolase
MDDTRVVRLISIGTPVDKYDDYNFLTEVRKPILFIHGDHDEFGSIENLRRLFNEVARNTDAELVVISDSGHFFDEHLNEIRDAIRDWTLKHIAAK